MKLTITQREELLDSLLAMHVFLSETFAHLSSDELKTPGPDQLFAPVEQVWHLADLEREGFSARIHRLLSECDPYLPDFDGTRAATLRNYRSLSFEEGLSAFAEARRSNVATLRAVDTDSWLLSGTQQGVGKVSLCDMPSFMSQHDAAHRIEIDLWKRFIARKKDA